MGAASMERFCNEPSFLIKHVWCHVLLTTWLMPETLDWRIVTASPIEGFWLALATAEARKARVDRELSC